MKVLIISAHPDDETIGAGGTIARHIANGDQVYWCVVTEGYTPTWPQEILDAARQQVFDVKELYGITEVFFLGFPTVRLNTVPYMELSSAIQKVVDKVQPEVVYTTPGTDLNQDHRIVFDCTLVATRPVPGCAVRRVLAYEIATTTRYGGSSGRGGFIPSVYSDISGYMETKLSAMNLYETEIRSYPHPRSPEGIKILCRERGLAVGVEAAECFYLVREFI